MPGRRLALTILLSLASFVSVAQAQDRDSVSVRPDSLAVEPPVPTDSAAALVRTPPRTSVTTSQPAPEGGLKSPVRFSARDSLVLTLDEAAGDVGHLFGATRVEYEKATLEAEGIDILFEIDELRAYASDKDTTSAGYPTFTQGNEVFRGRRMAYNMSTDRGRVVDARTQFEDGFIRAEVAKVTEDSTLYIVDGVYTTCECVDDPSYSLRSSKMKVVDQKWVYTGPIQLFIFNIPMPLWLPFGILPAVEGRRSGPLPPQYGEDEFGFYLRDWGWYWALNDYTDLQLRLGIWSRGSFRTSTRFRYNRRYRYNGNLNLDFARLRNGESGDPDFEVQRTGSIRWNHSQTLNPTSSLSANVDLTTSGFLRAVSEAYDDRVRQTVSSSVAYRKRWARGARSISVNLNQRQSFETGSVDLTVPSFSFTQNTSKPFLRDSRGPGEREQWYEKLSFRYSMNLSNSYSFTPLSDETLLSQGDTAATDISWYEAFLSPDKYRRATGSDEPFRFRASHDIPISAAFTLNRLPLLGNLRLNVSPNFTYEEDWFIRTERRSVVDSTNAVVRESVPGFLALRQFSTGISTNTTFYGIFPLSVGPYSGLRHTVRPTLSFSYQPDFGDDKWGYTRTYADTTGQLFEYSIVSGVRQGKQQALSYSIANTFETKRVAADTTSETRRGRTVKLLNLDVSSRYNFAADSLKMGDITLNARSRILGAVDVNFRSTFSPYRQTETGQTINQYVFNLGGFDFARLRQFSVSARASMRSSQRGQRRPVENPRSVPSALDPLDRTIDPISGALNQNLGGAAYSDFSIPWSLSVDFTYGLTKTGTRSTRRAIMNTNVDFNLTPNWKVSARTGYDFELKELVTTSLALYRDFECWQMSINWIPFGDFQSYGFDLHVKSGHLAELLRIRQPRSDIKGRLGSVTGF
ncbi:MAG: LPS-assembly protein LptD [Rhodothermia bacterium]|nr:LPS-assembly protein LptD [Rhodothermia bacterium]